MSAYNDAVAYLDAEVHSRCDYDIYSDMRDIVDEMEAENAKLREYVTKLEQANIVLDSDNTDLPCDMKDMQFFIDENAKLRELCMDIWKLAHIDAHYGARLADRMRELGIEVED